MREKKVRISVVVPTLNEQKYIRTVLFGLERQTFRNFEIITVDGGSKDKTRDIARRHGKVILNRRKGVGFARNIGAGAAKGDILLFLDADTKPSENLLDVYRKAFMDKNLVAATGPILPLEETTRKMRAGYKFVSIYFVRFSIFLHKPKFIGSNFAVRRSAFVKAGGFNDKLMTYEDWELSGRLKKYGKMRFIRKAAVHTSIRRVMKWGMLKYSAYYVVNMFRHKFFKTANRTYAPIR